MPDPTISRKSELTGAIEAAWQALNAYVDKLGARQLSEIRDAEGWSVKDHLAHLARWEASVGVLFHGRARHEGLGIDHSLYTSAEFDEINAVLHERTKYADPAAVRIDMRRSHDDLLSSLSQLSDADLNRKVCDFFPQAPRDDDRRVIDLIFDNTAQHFSEHLGWIEELVQAAP